MKATNKKASTSPKIELQPALCRVVWLFKCGHMGYFRIRFPSRIIHTHTSRAHQMALFHSRKRESHRLDRLLFSWVSSASPNRLHERTTGCWRAIKNLNAQIFWDFYSECSTIVAPHTGIGILFRLEGAQCAEFMWTCSLTIWLWKRIRSSPHTMSIPERRF